MQYPLRLQSSSAPAQEPFRCARVSCSEGRAIARADIDKEESADL
jgi:hypothetical protein